MTKTMIEKEILKLKIEYSLNHNTTIKPSFRYIVLLAGLDDFFVTNDLAEAQEKAINFEKQKTSSHHFFTQIWEQVEIDGEYKFWHKETYDNDMHCVYDYGMSDYLPYHTTWLCKGKCLNNEVEE